MNRIEGREIAQAGEGLKGILEKLYKNDDVLMSYKHLDVAVGLGWHPIVLSVAAALAGKGVAFTCIKEKWGGLRIYTSSVCTTLTEDEIWKIIGEAEDTASQTCEHCGSPGEARDMAWVKTLCDICSDNAMKLYYTTGTGQRLRTHRYSKDCQEFGCVIHNPSKNIMSSFPTHYRFDRGIMERICPCGVGHLDEDNYNWLVRTKGAKHARMESIHGCCGSGCHYPKLGDKQ